jgi:hypothetical protein
MKLILLALSTFILLAGYVYTLFFAHIKLARVDKKITVPRRLSGEIKIKDLKELVIKSETCSIEIKGAIFLLSLSNYTIHLLFGGIILFLITNYEA